MGENVRKSKSAVVVHRIINDQGIERPVGIDMNNFFIGDDVLVFPPTTVQKAPDINNSEIDLLKQLISKWANSLDTLLDKNYLSQYLKIFPYLFFHNYNQLYLLNLL